MKRNILVLGGNGFIGKNLVNLLVKKGEHVISFDLHKPEMENAGVEYIEGNFFEDRTLGMLVENADVIYHCICTINPGNSEKKYLQAYEKDFIQTVKLVELVKNKGNQMIFLSSGGTVYGRQEIVPIREEAILAPINHYGNLKVCIENTIRIFNRLDGTHIKIARVANPYGPGQDYGKGVGFIDAVLKNGLQKQTVKVWGDGKVIRDYVYIDDVCEMLYILADYSGEVETFNIGTGEGKSQNDIIKIAKKWFPDLKVEYLEARGVDVPQNVLSNKKIMGIYDKNLKSLESGMENYYNYLICNTGKAGKVE